MDAEFRKILASHLALDMGDLRTCRRLEPLPAQERIIRATVADARRLGKSVPRSLPIYTVERPGDILLPPGMTVFDRDTGRIEVFLDVGYVMPEALQQTTYHEMSHVHDFLLADFDQLAGEERAIDFAAWAMGWR